MNEGSVAQASVLISTSGSTAIHSYQTSFGGGSAAYLLENVNSWWKFSPGENFAKFYHANFLYDCVIGHDSLHQTYSTEFFCKYKDTSILVKFCPAKIFDVCTINSTVVFTDSGN